MGKRSARKRVLPQDMPQDLPAQLPRLLPLCLAGCRQAGLQRRLPLAAPVALLALLAGPAHADWKFTPTVDLRGTYTDNVALAADDRREGRFIAEVTPGFSLVNNTPRLKLAARYQLHYYAYDDDGVDGARHLQSTLSSQVSAILVDDLLFFDGNAAVGQQAISAFGPQVTDNYYAGANRSTVKSYSVSPYLRHSFGASASAMLRYTRDEVSAGNSGLGNSSGDALFFNLASGPLFRRVGWGVQASYQRLHDNIAADSEVKIVGANLRYRLTDSFSLTGAGGYDEYDYQTVGEPVKGKNWSAGFDWTPSLRTSVRANAGKRYYGNSYFLDAQHRSRRSVWTLNYNDAVTTTRAQFLLPATIDTAAVIDRLFIADIPDPVARRAAVDAYIRATGLPASLAESVNYFSNRYILQKQLQLSAAFNTARTTVVLSAFNTRRDALSSFQADGAITGPSSGNFNDDTTQTGVSALLNYRLTSRSSVNLSATTARSESNTSSLETRNTALRMALTRTFTPRMSGSAELRHTTGNTALGAASYRENAITASLSLKL